MYYVEDEFDLGFVCICVGVKKFNVDIEKMDNFDLVNNLVVNIDLDILFLVGIVVFLFIEGVEVFVGYGENFVVIKDV